jgi:membrane-associated phospholipid phosphatase
MASRSQTAQRSAACGPTFGYWSRPATLAWLAATWAALALLFFLLPRIDLAVSHAFFEAGACKPAAAGRACGVFGLSQQPFWATLRTVFQDIPAVAAVALVVVLIRDLTSGLRWEAARVRFVGVALATLALGPGLLVNALLKNNWGRPRPHMTDLFGGDWPFVPAGEWSQFCPRNCSFISGEASSIFWLACLVPLLPSRLRPAALALALGLAAFASGLRVAFGAHYVSDVVLGGLSTWVIFAALAWLADARRIDKRPANIRGRS